MWVAEANLEPEGGLCPDYVAYDETVVKVKDERFRLVAADESNANNILCFGLFC